MTPEEELQRIIDLYGEDRATITGLLERQFGVLQARAQVLLGLTGVVVTTTGFSGRLIAGTNLWAQVLIIVGMGLVLAACVVVVFGVLHLKWLTQQPGAMLREWLLTCLRYRNTKMCYYRWSMVLLIAGLTFYVGAMAIMLLVPRAFDLGVGR